MTFGSAQEMFAMLWSLGPNCAWNRWIVVR